MTGDVAFMIGAAAPVDMGTTMFGGVTIGGIMAGVEALFKTDAIGVIEGCSFGTGTGAIGGFAMLVGPGQLGAWFAVTVIHNVTVVVCVCGVTVIVTVSVCA